MPLSALRFCAPDLRVSRNTHFTFLFLFFLCVVWLFAVAVMAGTLVLLGYLLYYHTSGTMWTKPWVLGNERLTARKRRRRVKRAKNMKPEEAANKIKHMIRASRARRMIRTLIRNMYRKAVDPATGKTYYYNKQTGATQWHKVSVGADPACRTSQGWQCLNWGSDAVVLNHHTHTATFTGQRNIDTSSHATQEPNQEGE